MASTSRRFSSLYSVFVALGFVAPGIWGLMYLFKEYEFNPKGSIPATSKGLFPELKPLNTSVNVFYEPPNRPTGEVIFFHDIQWREYKTPEVETWMSDNSSQICWPKDWLSSEFPESRITSVCYDSAMRTTNITGRMDPYIIVENLWQDILAIYTENCPVFLVGHGVGGLVIKKLIYSMQEKLGCISDSQALTKDKLSSFLENIKGVFFYDSPILGIRLGFRNFFHQGSPILKMIKILHADTSRLNQWFMEWRRKARCKSAAISASLPTKVTLGYGFHRTFQLVEEASSRHDMDHYYTSFTSDHFSICKPRDQIDGAYLMLVIFLKQESLSRKEGPLTQIKDSDICASTVPRNHGSRGQKEDSVGSACMSLTTLLNRVATIKHRQGVYLERENLEKIRQFPEMERRLVEGLNNAGLKQRKVWSHVEKWDFF